ncbi:MAG: DUF4349 domain-containing protein [Clostridia bacterium]|nr:DUF4349 domain-containing protein [Clostridia bacterium]
MKKLALISLATVLCLSFSACGTAAKDSMAVTAPSNSGNKSYYFVAEDSADTLYSESLEYGTVTGSTSSAVVQEEKLVYTSYVTLETEEFETATDSLHSTIKSLGGIIISENAYNLNSVNRAGYRSLEMTVRIPQESYDTFLSGLSESYNVASIRNTVDNLTETYYDNENRLRSYRIQEERLFAMLEKAETVEEMLRIEERLCEVQYQIEALTNTQRTIDNDVKYATFHLNLEEVTKYTSPVPKTFGDRLGETLTDSGETFLEVLESLLFAFIYLAPYLAIFAVILVVVLLCVKRSNKKRFAKIQAANEVKRDEK